MHTHAHTNKTNAVARRQHTQPSMMVYIIGTGGMQDGTLEKPLKFYTDTTHTRHTQGGGRLYVLQMTHTRGHNTETALEGVCVTISVWLVICCKCSSVISPFRCVHRCGGIQKAQMTQIWCGGGCGGWKSTSLLVGQKRCVLVQMYVYIPCRKVVVGRCCAVCVNVCVGIACTYRIH